MEKSEITVVNVFRDEGRLCENIHEKVVAILNRILSDE